MDSSDSTYFIGMFKKSKKLRSPREGKLIKLVVIVLLVSLAIYLWLLSLFVKKFSNPFICPDSNPSCISDTTTSRPQFDDFGTLINLKNFSFIMNNDHVCNNSNPVLLAMIHSHPNHTMRRETIRDTWGSVTSNTFKLVFLIGIPQNKKMQSILEVENEFYGDLIQGNFIDDYRNMTYKHVMGLKWVTYYCPQSKYILKADDDVFVNSPAILKHINTKLIPRSVKNLIYCSMVQRARVKRSSKSKWKVSFVEYSFPYYPTYCEGFAILYSSDVVKTLYMRAQRETYFWIDDVHVTGFLAAKAHLKHSPFGKALLMSLDQVERFQNVRTAGYSFLIGPYNLQMEEIVLLWNKISRSARF